MTRRGIETDYRWQRQIEQRVANLERPIRVSQTGLRDADPDPPASGRSPVLFVAASNAADWEKAAADYICDGVDDDVEILAAVAAAGDAWEGCPVKLSGGDFYVSAFIDAPSWVPIRGSGRKNTYIRWTGSGSWAGVTLRLADVADMFIDMTGAGAAATALEVANNARDLWISSNGKGVLADGTGVLVEHVEPWAIGGNFLEVAANDAFVRNIHFAGGWSSAALALLVHGVGGGSTTIEGCLGGGSGTMVQIDSFASYTLLTGNRFIASGSSAEPLVLVDGDKNDIVGNQFAAGTAGVRTAVEISGTGDRNIVAYNTFRDFATNVSDLGTNSVITPNAANP